MRFIKSISIILLLLTAFSCRKTPLPDVSDLHRIEFRPKVETKSFIANADDLEFKKGFAVFAKKTERIVPSGENAAPVPSKEIMTNVKVSFTDGQWTYSPDVLWGLNCDHEFLGVYPYKTNGTDYTFGKDQIYHLTLVNTLSTEGKPIGEDIMYARYQEYYNIGMSPQPIVLHFTHALTAVSFKIRNVSTKDIINITDISLGGLYTRATNLAIPRDASKKPTIDLDVPITNENGELIQNGSIGTYHLENFTTPIPPADQDWKILTSPSIILPQSLLNMEIKFKFTVNFANSPQQTYTYNLEKVALQNDITTKYDYLPGKHYIYRIDILDRDIKFSVEVKDWTEEEIIELK